MYERDKYTCQYCGVILGKENKSQLTVDHVVPKLYGGLHNELNLRTSCRTCNSRRGKKSIEDFRFLMRLHHAGIGGVISISQAKDLLRRGIDLRLPEDYKFYFEQLISVEI